MRVLFDEGVDYGYQKEFKKQHPEHEVSNAQAMGWGGESEVMKGLSPEQKDVKLAELAKDNKVDALITVDKKFHDHAEVPTNVLVISPANDEKPHGATLQKYNDGIENELQNIEKNPDREPERIIIDNTYLEQMLDKDRDIYYER